MSDDIVTGEEIERAERILGIIYQENSVPRQLINARVEMTDFHNFLQNRVKTASARHTIAWSRVDPRVHQAYNTLLMHFFLVGLIIGRSEGGSL